MLVFNTIITNGTTPSLKVLLIALSILLTSKFGWTEVHLRDPKIPDGEKIIYNLYMDDEKSTLEEEVAVKEENNQEIYEITSKSKYREQVIKILKDSMFVYSMHVILKGEDATIDRKISLIENKSKLEEDEIGVIEFYGLNYFLRGFPFDEIKYVKIKILGGRNPFSLKVKLVGEEPVKINDKEIDCFKLKLGMPGIWGKFFSKTYLWYSIDTPHCLVRYEGPSGGPGSPKRVLELIDYSVKSE